MRDRSRCIVLVRFLITVDFWCFTANLEMAMIPPALPFAAHSTSHSHFKSFAVLTQNLYGAEDHEPSDGRAHAFAETFERQAPDMVALQEVQPFNLRALWHVQG